MDEDNTEPGPSRNKKNSEKDTSRHDIRDKKEHDDAKSISGSSTSRSYSEKSGPHVPEEKLENSKAPIDKKQSKNIHRRKKTRGDKRRRRGRIYKRRRSETRRQLMRKTPRRKQRSYIKKDFSVSTIFTRLSPERSRRSRSPGCQYCGHRCCLRRYRNKLRRNTIKKSKTQKNGQRKKRKKQSECIQAGSRCAMLSPLFINTNSVLAREAISPISNNYAQITPEMIHNAVAILTMWRAFVSTQSILRHLIRTYPVNSNEIQLLEELKEKLRIAVFVGIVAKLPADTWCLNSALGKRKVSENQVTIFWKIYLDTLRAVKKKRNGLTI